MRIYATWLAAVIMASFGHSSAWAQDDEWNVTGDVEVRVEEVSEDDNGQMAKFNEYRDVIDGATGDVNLRAENQDGTYRLDVMGDNLGRKDSSLNLGVGKYGLFSLDLLYDQSPHNFYDGAKTLYVETSPGVYEVPDTVQGNIQSAVDAGGSDGTTKELLEDYLSGAHEIDLALERKTLSADLKFNLTKNVNARLDVSREERQGKRQFAGYFWFGRVRELPEPIDYSTTIMNASVGYHDEDYKLLFGYNLSSFKNNVNTLTFDNIYQAEDTASFGSRGRMDLYPDNSSYNYHLSGAANLPFNSRLTGYWAFGHMSQNDQFMPDTINTVLTTDPLSRSSLDGKVDTETRNLRLNIKPVDMLTVNLKYRYYDYDNKTDVIDWYRYVRADAGMGGWRRNMPLSFKYERLGAGAALDIIDGLSASLAYQQEDRKREYREIADSKDKEYRIGVNYRPAGEMGWLFIKGSYTMGERRGDHYYDVTEEEGISADGFNAGAAGVAQLPMLQKFDIGDRDSTQLDLLAQLSPMQGDLVVTANYMSGKEDYKVMDRHIPTDTDPIPWVNYPGAEEIDKLFGLTSNEMNVIGVDATYAVSRNIVVSAFVTQETYKYSQRSRNSGGTISGSSSNDWKMDGEDSVSTWGLGLNGVLAQLVSFDAQYTLSDAKGKTTLSGPETEGTDVSIPDTKNKVQSFNIAVDYLLGKSFSIGLDYLYEKYEVTDWAIDNVALYAPAGDDPNANNLRGDIFMGIGNNSYDVNVIALVAKYKF